jgi:hypothetical protein
MQPAENLAEVKSGRYCTLVQEREVRVMRVEGRGLGFLGSGVRFDSKDFPSKRLFSFILFLLNLTDTGEKQGAPIITIPAG